MANNFRIAGSGYRYVSKAGRANAVGTMDDPFDHPSRIDGGITVLGTGVYVIAGNLSDVNNNVNWFCDGTVKVLGNNTDQQILSTYYTKATDVYFDQFAGIRWSNQVNDIQQLTRCIIKLQVAAAFSPNIRVANSNYAEYIDSILYNVDTNGHANDIYTRCIFINCKVQQSASVTGCYIDPTSSIVTTSASNNNVDPACVPASGQGLNVNGAGFSLTSPTGISAPPLFNSVAKEDFTLRANSPHILRGIGPSHLRYANSFYLEYSGGSSDAAGLGNTRLRGTGSNTTVPLLNITDGAQGFEVNSQSGLVLQALPTSIGFGTFTTGRIPFADIADEMTVMLLKAGLNFNTSFPALESQFNMNQPEIFNNNVPDWSNYAPGNAGRNPNRLSYRMRWSIKSNPNADLTNVADWITGTQFIEFEWNKKPMWNPATSIGNGEAGYDHSAGQPIQCTFYQLQICIRNNSYR